MGNISPPYEVLPGVLNIPGVGVGSVTNRHSKTGVTVVWLPDGVKGGVEVAGGAPATREVALLDPSNTISGPHAVVLSGGSALGLATADGAAQALQSLSRGVDVGGVRIPIVVGAAVFDMLVGEPVAPSREDGAQALELASRLSPLVEEGLFGAGTGTTVGKSLGPQYSMPGGQGAVTLKTSDGILVGALIVVNAVGSVLDEHGAVMAGPLVEGVPYSTTELWARAAITPRLGEATTIGVVVTNANLSKSALARVARMSHDGLARCIDPLHTPWDGDTLFAISVGTLEGDIGRVGALAAHASTLAVRRAVRAGNHKQR